MLLCSTNFLFWKMDELTPQELELNKFLSEVHITVRKKRRQRGITRPNSLRVFFASFDRHLKKKKTMDFDLWKTRYRQNLDQIVGSDHRIGSSDRIIGLDHLTGSSDRIIVPDHRNGSSDRIIVPHHRNGSSDRIGKIMIIKIIR